MAQENEVMHRLNLIAAIGTNTRALGKGGDLLFKIPDDLARFRRITKGHPVIMGRKTWDSLPAAFRPLPGRANIVVSRQLGFEALGAAAASSLDDALTIAREASGSEEIFVIGGSELYTLALPYADRLYLTLVEDDAEGDVFFPDYASFVKEIEREENRTNAPSYTFVTLEK